MQSRTVINREHDVMGLGVKLLETGALGANQPPATMCPVVTTAGRVTRPPHPPRPATLIFLLPCHSRAHRLPLTSYSIQHQSPHSHMHNGKVKEFYGSHACKNVCFLSKLLHKMRHVEIKCMVSGHRRKIFSFECM